MSVGTAAQQVAEIDFTPITERPDTRASADQLSILYTRYQWASQEAAQKDVLEVACGAGVGLGLLASRARSVAAGDIDPQNCRTARETYRGDPRLRIERFRAERLTFPEASLDLVIAFEAIYYFPDAREFLSEAKRVLRPGGRLLLSTVNCRWQGFNPSPLHTRYYDASELKELVESCGFRATILAGFAEVEGALHRLVRLVRRVAVGLHLIPKTMKGKEWLKRLFYGRLRPIPRRLEEGAAAYSPPIELPDLSDSGSYRFLYAVATKTAGHHSDTEDTEKE